LNRIDDNKDESLPEAECTTDRFYYLHRDVSVDISRGMLDIIYGNIFINTK